MIETTRHNDLTLVRSNVRVMSLPEFAHACFQKAFTSYDGFGHPVMADPEEELVFLEDCTMKMGPRTRIGDIPDWCTHVAWYNK